MTQTQDTVSDYQDVGADAGATAQPDPEIEVAQHESHPEVEPEPGPAAPEVAGGEDDPAEKAAEEDQPGANSEPATNSATDRPRRRAKQDRLF